MSEDRAVELELTVLQEARRDRGYIEGFAITERLIVAAGGTSSTTPTVLASSNARHFEPRTTPRQLGLRDVLAVGDGLWTCGEYGQLAVSRDDAVTWRLYDTATDGCLFALARARDGAVWCVGDAGYAARVVGDRLERVDFATAVRLESVTVLGDEIVALGFDGAIRRWRDGRVTTASTGATGPLTALAVTRLGTWIVVGDAGFIARSPDGAWFTRVKTGVDLDLEAIAALDDGWLVAVGARGQILGSTDDGRSWTAVAGATDAHLWAIERFGGGALIGGDHGLVLKLAPSGDATWHDRVDVFGGAKPLDEVFAAGPDGFVATGVAAYLAAIDDHDDEADDDDDEDDDEDDDDEDDEDDDDDDDDDEADDDAFQTLRAAGDAGSFERNYGIAPPPELARLRAAVEQRKRFAGLRLTPPMPDVGAANLFELVVRRDQRAYLGTGLVDAFCGTFCLGSQPNGDTLHMELYEWDGPRQVLHYDHETHAFTGVLADSLDSLAYLAALEQARGAQELSDDAFAIGLRRLRGRVAPPWHDPAFVRLDARRRDTELFFYRSRWIRALLAHDGITKIADIPQLFLPDFNQIVPDDQLPARLDACERFIPTALYSMWRAFLFDEPELARYLEIGRRHRARLVRDAAQLVDELRGGRNELGTIGDVRAHLAAFRALGLDPRRTDQHDELARTPRAGWTTLAWRWLDDGDAHRALLARLDDDPDFAPQLAALDELSALSDLDRANALPRLAADLAPELEALLVGSLVRDDELVRGSAPSPSWAAIDRALEPLYRGVVPHVAYGEPIHGISVYPRVDHFHFVTYGFTEAGLDFELTFRLGRAPDDAEVPDWALNFLQNLGRYVFDTGRGLGTGDRLDLAGPLARDSRLTAIALVEDPELGGGRFLQIVGITDGEHRLIQEWSVGGLFDVLRRSSPLLVTDLARASVHDDPELTARVATEGSSDHETFAAELAADVDGDAIRIELGARSAARVPPAIRGRLRHGRPFTLRGEAATVQLRPSATVGHDLVDDELTVMVSTELATELEARLGNARPGTYRFEAWPALQIVVARDGAPADPDRVRAALAMTERALRLAPDDADVQFTHAMLLVDADRIDELVRALPRLRGAVQVNVAVRLGKLEHVRFGELVDAIADGDSYDDADELLVELGQLVVARAPDRLAGLARVLPPHTDSIARLARQAIEAGERSGALALYDRLVALPIPDDGERRASHLRALDTACVLTRAAKAYDTAVRIAERAQPVAHENPHLYHAAACAYAAVGDYARAFEQIELAFEHGYDHLGQVEADQDLGPLLEWPEFKALFRDWHARQDGN